MTRHFLPALLLALGALACGDAGQDDDAPAATPDADPPAAFAGDTAGGPLERHAASIVAFLRGGGDLNPAILADTVTLRVTPEGGGARARVAREALVDRSAWRVGDHEIAPPSGLPALTLAEGRHFRCQEGALAPVAPDLAAQPHVGAVLRADSAGSCLQTWNATFVFGEPGPRLTAVVYDQWEW